MNKQEIFNRYSTIIDEMLENSLFFDTYFQRPFGFEEIIDGEDYDELPSGLLISSGATRTCLIDKDYDWVVKFDIAEDRYGSACSREEKIYKAAKKESLEKYFAEVVYLGNYTKTINFYDIDDIEQYIDYYGYDPETFERDFADNEEKFGEIFPVTICIPLFAYRKADFYDCGPVDANSRMLAQEIVSPLRARNIAVATAFIREFGMEQYKIFSDFSLKWDINDLHCNNIGEIDKHFAIIDYSGYHSLIYEDEDEDED